MLEPPRTLVVDLSGDGGAFEDPVPLERRPIDVMRDPSISWT